MRGARASLVSSIVASEGFAQKSLAKTVSMYFRQLPFQMNERRALRCYVPVAARTICCGSFLEGVDAPAKYLRCRVVSWRTA